jgi:hypothetical protein
MGAENLNSVTLNAYDYGFRRDAHQLLAWGHQDSLPQIHCDLMEEEITGLIVEAIERKIDNPTTPEKFLRYYVEEEKPISVEGRKGKSRRRLDLVVVSGHSRPRPKYIFEAKRLRKNGYPIGKYIGEDGLQCFSKGVYASQYPEAAMVAYLQSNTSSYWEKELKRSVNNDLSCTKQPSEKISVIESIPDVWVSEHDREQSSSIIVYHIFLNCIAKC